MKYYLSVVLFALLMGGLSVLLQPHPVPVPGIAMMGLFGVHHGDLREQEDALPLPRHSPALPEMTSRESGNSC